MKKAWRLLVVPAALAMVAAGCETADYDEIENDPGVVEPTEDVGDGMGESPSEGAGDVEG